MYFFVSIVASIEQIFLLYIVIRDPLRLLNKPATLLNITVATIHLFAALVVLPYIGVISILRSQDIVREPSNLTKLFEDFMVCFFVSATTLFVFAIFAERSIAFAFPILNRKHVTIERVKRFCFGIVVTSVLFSGILFTGVPKNIFYLVFFPVLIFLPTLGLLILPIGIAYGLKQQATKVETVKRNDSLSTQSPTTTRKGNPQRKPPICKNVAIATGWTILAIAHVTSFSVVDFLEFSDAESSQRIPCLLLFKHISYLNIFLPLVIAPIVCVMKIPVFLRSAKHILKLRWSDCNLEFANILTHPESLTVSQQTAFRWSL